MIDMNRMIDYIKNIVCDGDYGDVNMSILTGSMSLHQSKNNMKYIFLWTKDKLRQYISLNDQLNGFFLFLLHSLFQIFVYFALLTSPIYSATFMCAIIFWVFILLSNIYFRGCLLLKLERYLWGTRSWYGPMYLFCEEEYITPNLANNFFICQQVIIITIIFLRVLFFTPSHI
jgi:hypothetical protein